MFQSARLKLTFWYLLIIMTISILFSVLIFSVQTYEINRVLHRQQQRIEEFRPSINNPGLRQILIGTEVLEEARGRIFFNLFLINTGILIIAGGAGYFLSGRTLKPIEDMVEEQKRFVSDASHEIRTPLTAMRTETEVTLLKKDLTLDEAKASLKSSLVDIARLQRFSDHLLTLARFENLNGSSQFEKFEIKEPIEQAMLEVKVLAKAKKIQIKTSLNKSQILGNKQSLKELFVIIFENAIKYSKNDTTIEIEALVENSKTVVRISDQGQGIAPSDLNHIFDRFYRAEKSRTNNGFGLGLAIAKKIVEEHSGTIQADSELAKGTTFSINFPIQN